MLKKKLLVSLVVIQGLLIIIGIIAIIFGVFYKMSNNNSSLNIINKNIEPNNIYLVNEHQYQKKIIKENKIIFQIIDIKSNNIMKEIAVEKN